MHQKQQYLEEAIRGIDYLRALVEDSFDTADRNAFDTGEAADIRTRRDRAMAAERSIDDLKNVITNLGSFYQPGHDVLRALTTVLDTIGPKISQKYGFNYVPINRR